MLVTLHSYILRELAKVFAITAISLTVILSLGGLLQPLRHHGISAVQLFELIGYFFPVMLTFSLPVSSLLATTLVYGRLSADNELIACRASGIGMAALVTPAAALGVAVMAANLALGNLFIPICAKGASDVVRQDLQDMAFQKLKSDKQLTYVNKWIIAADRVEKTDDDPPKICLFAPSIAELAKGQPQQMIMCKLAVMEFDLRANAVTFYPRDAVAMSWEHVEEPARVVSLPIRMFIPPDLFAKDEVSFKSYRQLQELRRVPDPYYKVKRELDKARRLTEHKLLYDEMIESLRPRAGAKAPRSFMMKYEDFAADGTAQVRDAVIEATDAQRVADGVLLGRADGKGHGVWITLLGLPPGPGRLGPRQIVYRARQAKLIAVTRDDQAGPMADVSFPDVFERQDLRDQSAPAIKAKGVMAERLLPPAELVSQVANMSRSQLQLSPEIDKAVQKEINKLQRNIVAELHSRAAFAVAALVLVLLGAALGVLFRSGHVLVAFGVAAVPAMFAITMVIMGNKISTNSTSSITSLGPMLIWSGNALILLINVGVYARMLKH